MDIKLDKPFVKHSKASEHDDKLWFLEELEAENREYFENAGGKNYLYIPCLNTNPMHIDMMSTIIEKHTQGWSV